MSIMRAKLFLLVFVFISDFAGNQLFAQNSQLNDEYAKWEIGLNGGYFIKPKVSIEPYGRINPNFLVLAKRNIKNGKNALRFSADVNYERIKYNPDYGTVSMPFTASFAGLIGFEKRFKAIGSLRPFVGIQQSFRFNLNQALAESTVNYPTIYKPENYESRNQKDFIFVSDLFTGLECKVYRNLFISGEVALKVESFVGRAGGFSFNWVLDGGINEGAILSAGFVPNRTLIVFRPFTFLNLTYKFK